MTWDRRLAVKLYDVCDHAIAMIDEAKRLGMPREAFEDLAENTAARILAIVAAERSADS